MTATHHSDKILFSGADSPRKWMRDLPIQCNPDYVVFYDDFTGVAVNSTNDWTVVKDTTATVAIAADTLNGRLLLSSTATTDDDGSSIQGNELFKAQAGKKIWFETKLQSADADQTDIVAGLTVNFATNPEAALTAADRICFQVNDGNASVLCKTEAGGTETSTDSGVDLADATDAVLGFLVDGTGMVEFYVNREKVATHTANITTTELTPSFMELSGNTTGTKSLSIDYVYVVAER